MQDRQHITATDLTDEVLTLAGFDPGKIDRRLRRKLAGVVDKIAYLNDYDAAKRRNHKVDPMSPEDHKRCKDQIQQGCCEIADAINAAAGDTNHNGVQRACDTLGRRFSASTG